MMSEAQSTKSEFDELDERNPRIIDGEVIDAAQTVETSAAKNPIAAENSPEKKTQARLIKSEGRRTNGKEQFSNQKYLLQYVLLPLVFLTVALLGGLRFGAEKREFIFLRPELVCLVFAAVLLALFFRAGLLRLSGWFSESFSTVKNVANAVVLTALYAASVQIFNSLLPEKGLAFWIVGFFFFWTLWNNLFSVFDAKRLVQSLGALFGLAFVVKYLLLANLVSREETWTQKILESVLREASLGLLDLPKFAPATGYAQFFALALYVIGLLLLRPQTNEE